MGGGTLGVHQLKLLLLFPNMAIRGVKFCLHPTHFTTPTLFEEHVKLTMSQIIDLSLSSPTQDSPRRPPKRSPRPPISGAGLTNTKSPYASEIIFLSSSDESDSESSLQELLKAGRPKRVNFECTSSHWLRKEPALTIILVVHVAQPESPVAGPSRSAAGGTIPSTHYPNLAFSQQDLTSPSVAIGSTSNVCPYANSPPFQKLTQPKADAFSRSPSMHSDIIQLSDAGIADDQSQDCVLSTDKASQSALDSHLDPIDAIVTQILEIIPDVSPDHALSLTQKYYPEHKTATHEIVLHSLFEDPNYPKVAYIYFFHQLGILTTPWRSSNVSGGAPRTTKSVKEKEKRRDQRSTIWPRIVLILEVSTIYPSLWCVALVYRTKAH